MKHGTRRVCGGDHRVALVAMAGEVSRNWKTTALLAVTFGAGAGIAAPVLLLHGRVVPAPAAGGNLGLVWRLGVQPVAVIQQQAVDALSGVLLGIAVAMLGVAAITILALALARENERAAELLVRRAVGAGPRTLLGSAGAEAGLIVLAGLAAGSVLGRGGRS